MNNKALLILAFSLFFNINSVSAEGKYNVSVEVIENTKESADAMFSYGDHNEAIIKYLDLIKQNKASQGIKADSWKKAGIIKYHQGKYIEAGDYLRKAQKLGALDSKINELLKEMSKIKRMNNNDGMNAFIVQVGLFKSSVNANNIIKNIKPINGEFRLTKEKRGRFYVVYFDGFKDRAHADISAERLMALNNGMEFFVKTK